MAPAPSKHSKCDQSACHSVSSINPTPSGDRLTFDCLHIIFGRIPLLNLIPLRLVSRSWNSTIVYICARKDRLTLAPYSPPAAPLGKSEFDLFWVDDLARYLVDRTENLHEIVHFPIGQLTKQSTAGLAQLFSGVTELRIRYHCHQLLQPHIAKIEILFRHFSSPNLKVFSFTLSSTERGFKNALHSISKNITTVRFPNLKQLDLCTEGDFIHWPLFSSFDLQTKPYTDMLAKLERISLAYHSPNWDTKRTLAKLGPNLSSLSLSLTEKPFYSRYPDDDVITLISMFDSVNFATSLTHLRLDLLHRASIHQFIRALCLRFQALKYVQLQIVGYRPGNLPAPVMAINGVRVNFYEQFNDQWTGPLATLQQLSQLRLHDFDVLCGADSSLPLVKKLTLCRQDLIPWSNFSQFNADRFCRAVATKFPNLEQLVLVCRPFRGDENEKTRAQELEQQVRQYLNHFVHLRSTALDFTAPEWR